MERLIYHGQIFVQIVLYENYCTFCSILLQVVMFYWGMFRVCVWCFLDWVCLLSHSFITCLWANENERRHTCVWLMCLYGCEWEFSSVELFVCNWGPNVNESERDGNNRRLWVNEWMNVWKIENYGPITNMLWHNKRLKQTKLCTILVCSRVQGAN